MYIEDRGRYDRSALQYPSGLTDDELAAAVRVFIPPILGQMGALKSFALH